MGQRCDKTQCRQLIKSQLTNKIGIDNTEHHQCDNAADHGQRQAQ